MQTLNTRFAAELAKLIGARISEDVVTIADGMMDPETYKDRCGQVKGLRWVLEQFEEVNKILDER